MTLARAWRRHLYGGLAGAALVPAALLVAQLTFTFAFAGGFAPLGVLGQALSGPSAPSAPASAPTAAPARPVTGRVGAPGIPRGTVAPGRRAVPKANPPARGGSRPSGSAGAGQPSPPRHPTVVDEIVGAGTAVTSQLPDPAGPLATSTLQVAGSTADQILPPGSSRLP